MKQDTGQKIRELMDEAIFRQETAGAALLVIKDGEEFLFEARGYADKETKKPYGRDTIVRLFSMSKPITSAAAMLLMERGQLDPGTPVSEVLPGFLADHLFRDGQRVSVDSPVTIYHLLNMTAGISYGNMETEAGRAILSYLAGCQAKMHGPDAVSTHDFAIGLGQLPLAYMPDTSWSYGLCADIMGAVIEAVSGMSFGDLLQKNIFDPLGMTDTGFYVPAEKQPRLASAYLTTGPGKSRPFTSDHLAVSYRMTEKPAFESGGAGLVSTIDDYARFAQMLLNGGQMNGVRILHPRTVAYMTGGKLTAPQQVAMREHFGLEGFTYANFLRIKEPEINYCSLSRPGEYGWDGWMGCYFANFPKEKITMVLTQQKAESGTTPLTRKIRNVLLTDDELI